MGVGFTTKRAWAITQNVLVLVMDSNGHQRRLWYYLSGIVGNCVGHNTAKTIHEISEIFPLYYLSRAQRIRKDNKSCECTWLTIQLVPNSIGSYIGHRAPWTSEILTRWRTLQANCPYWRLNATRWCTDCGLNCTNIKLHKWHIPRRTWEINVI